MYLIPSEEHAEVPQATEYVVDESVIAGSNAISRSLLSESGLTALH